MKKLLTFVLSCVAIVVIVDVVFGAFSNWYVKNRVLPGDFESVDYLIKRSTDDVIILGSSIALYSLMPEMIEDSLALSCFNGGENGQLLTFHYTMLETILSRYAPKIIVLALLPDELTGSGVGGHYNLLVPYYDKGYALIDSCLERRDRYEPYLLKSNLYRYNTIWWRIFHYHFITVGERGKKGFVARTLPAVFPTLCEYDDVETETTAQREAEFVGMAERCRKDGVLLVVYFPPQYVKRDGKTATILFVENYCKEHGIPCFDDSQNKEFLAHAEWFYDNIHLNKDGAKRYTEWFLDELAQDSIMCRLRRIDN